LRTITSLRLKKDRRGVSNIIVVVLSLVVITVIASNVVLFSYQMNQLDWEKIHENMEITVAGDTLSAHEEITTVGGTNYITFRLVSADRAGTNFDVPRTVGRHVCFRAVYPLTGISSIPASTWTIYFRVQRYRTATGAVTLPVCYADVDILIRKSDDTIRAIIATNVANSPNLAADLDVWETVSATYSWSAYTVVDQTDYLEVDFYIEVTTAGTRSAPRMRIDDSSLPVADQTRVAFSLEIFTFKNRGSLTSRLVSLWVNNSTYHQRYAIDVIVNSGETISYLSVDTRLPDGQYTVKVVTERGNVAVYSGS